MSVTFSKFPAKLTFSDGRKYDPTGCLVTAGVFVAAEKRGREAVVIATGDVVEVVKNPDRSHTVMFEDGASVRVDRGKGCSCGSPLKTWFGQQLRDGEAA